MADDAHEDVTGPILRGDVLAARAADSDAPPLAQPAPPVPPVGQHPAFEQPCDAPGCDMRTPHFVVTTQQRIHHFCEAHQAWAMAQVKEWQR